MSTKKSLFHIHDPMGTRYLFQLRLGLSPLRSHKNNHGFIDTPSAICLCDQDIENTNHFLFSCPMFTNQRVVLIDNVSVILQKYNLINLANKSLLYLYGNSIIDLADNKQILLLTIKYIKETFLSSNHIKLITP